MHGNHGLPFTGKTDCTIEFYVVKIQLTKFLNSLPPFRMAFKRNNPLFSYPHLVIFFLFSVANTKDTIEKIMKKKMLISKAVHTLLSVYIKQQAAT